ncbi:hypothetical protein AVEN_32560-1 [Araneus ventricosus]|uniref:Uncharacterized protein n=1 Tax=Araneus ventricosus TaxID=182803 RepID=A0A4Y2L3T4_ARAVE|nr:hypothetical protein AVEN_32560-1 [Araneus ventricosus]
MTRTRPELEPPSRRFRTTPRGGRLTSYLRFNVQRPQNTTDLQWNLVSSLEPSGPKAETYMEHLRQQFSFPNLWLINKRFAMNPLLLLP